MKNLKHGKLKFEKMIAATVMLAGLMCISGCAGNAQAEEVPDTIFSGVNADLEIASIFTNLPNIANQTAKEISKPVKVTIGDVTLMSDAEVADLSGMDLNEVDVEDFLTNMTKLKKLTIKNCGLDNDGYAALQDAHPDVRMIWNIKTRYWTIPTDAVGFSTLIGLNDNRRLYNDDVKYFKYCTDMVALDIGHCCVSDLSFLQYMPNLRVLILVENYPTDGSSRRLKDISYLKYCPHIRYLEFFANDVNDISVLSELKELEDLNFCYNPVTDATPIYDLPNLKKLWIYGTRIPAEQKAELRELYPNTVICLSGSGSVDQGWRSGERYWAMRNMVKNNVIDDVYKFE